MNQPSNLLRKQPEVCTMRVKLELVANEGYPAAVHANTIKTLNNCTHTESDNRPRKTHNTQWERQPHHQDILKLD